MALYGYDLLNMLILTLPDRSNQSKHAIKPAIVSRAR